MFWHCSFCPKASATAFSTNAYVQKADFQILTGETDLPIYTFSSGKHRYYCSHCHSQLFHVKEEQPDVLMFEVWNNRYVFTRFVSIKEKAYQ
ncbi:GFA family protein [Streptococcus saliviloxodontae]